VKSPGCSEANWYPSLIGEPELAWVWCRGASPSGRPRAGHFAFILKLIPSGPSSDDPQTAARDLGGVGRLWEHCTTRWSDLSLRAGSRSFIGLRKDRSIWSESDALDLVIPLVPCADVRRDAYVVKLLGVPLALEIIVRKEALEAVPEGRSLNVTRVVDIER
jgi:hypothetical protein